MLYRVGVVLAVASAAGAGPVWAQQGSAAAPPSAASAPAPTLDVRAFDISGNTLLTPALIDARLEAYKGPATPQRLREAAAAVQELYRDAGWGGVVAFLPEQTPKDGLVRIRIVEGKLASIGISGNQQFSSDNIRASLPSLQEGRTPAVRLIDAEIQLANENPAKALQVLLQPGDQPGSIAARLTVDEQPVQRISARVDNTGTERTGRWRAALGWQHANLFDRDQVLGVELQTAPEKPSAVAVVSANYRVPLYGHAMAIDAYGAWSDVDAGRTGTPAGDLQFSGRGGIAGLRGSFYLPRLGNTDQRLLLGLEWRAYRNNCSIEGLPAGACGAAGSSVTAQPLSLTYSAQSVGVWRLGFSAGLHHNLALGGADSSAADYAAVRAGSTRRYTALRVAAQAALPDTWGTASARFSGQASSQALIPGELFGIGGAFSVRGFEERELAGDSGAQLTLEYQSPELTALWNGAAPAGAELRAVAFTDAGWVHNVHQDACLNGSSSCHLGSAGLGLRLGWRQLQLRLDVARAFTNAVTTRRGDMHGHFSLIASF